MPSCCHSCTNPAWEAKTLMALGCSILRLRERTTLTGAAGRKKRVARCAGLLRRLWPLPIRKNRTAASGRTIVGRKGTCGTASITGLPGRPARRRVRDPETIGRIPAVLVPRVSIQIARVPTDRNRTVHIQIDHIQIARVPTGRPLTVPGQRGRDSTARQERVGERGVQVRTIEDFSLLRAMVLPIAEALAAQRNRIASL